MITSAVRWPWAISTAMDLAIWPLACGEKRSAANPSPAFAQNPIGVFFKPDEVLAAHRKGAGLEELHRRMMAAEFEPNPVPVLSVPDPV